MFPYKSLTRFCLFSVKFLFIQNFATFLPLSVKFLSIQNFDTFFCLFYIKFLFHPKLYHFFASFLSNFFPSKTLPLFCLFSIKFLFIQNLFTSFPISCIFCHNLFWNENGHFLKLLGGNLKSWLRFTLTCPSMLLTAYSSSVNIWPKILCCNFKCVQYLSNIGHQLLTAWNKMLASNMLHSHQNQAPRWSGCWDFTEMSTFIQYWTSL